MERRILPMTGIQVRAADDGKTQRITGYGAVYYDGTPETEFVLWDDQYGRAVERILPGAFDRAARDDDVRGMYNHQDILGRTKAGTMRLNVDSRGLLYDIDVPDTTVGRDVVTSIERGDVDGSSFLFTIPPGGQRWTRTEDADGKSFELREVLEVDLFDTGPVDFPAYEGTTTGIRAVGDVADARKSFEDNKKRSDAARLSMDRVKTQARLVELAE